MQGTLVKSTGLVLDTAHQPGLAEPPATTLKDYCRWGNNGTFLGVGEPDWVQLPSGLWVMQFDGVNDFVNCGNDKSLDLTTVFTMMFWANIAIYGSGGIIDKTTSYQFNLYGGSVRLRMNGAYYYYSAGWDAFLNRWIHFVWLYDSVLGTRIYCNAVPKAGWDVTVTGALNPNVDNMRLGIGVFGTLEGSLALFQIYKRLWTPGKINQSFEAERRWFGV